MTATGTWCAHTLMRTLGGGVCPLGCVASANVGVDGKSPRVCTERETLKGSLDPLGGGEPLRTADGLERTVEEEGVDLAPPRAQAIEGVLGHAPRSSERTVQPNPAGGAASEGGEMRGGLLEGGARDAEGLADAGLGDVLREGRGRHEPTLGVTVDAVNPN